MNVLENFHGDGTYLENAVGGIPKDASKIQLEEFATHIYKEKLKGKIPLIITGSGISTNLKMGSNKDKGIPDTKKMIEKLTEFLKKNKSQKSEFLTDLINDFEVIKNINEKKEECILIQSKLLTYVQNGYLENTYYIEKMDLKILESSWRKFIIWLNNECIDKNIGIIKAEPSETHEIIVEMYKKMGAVSITTNFDNLLCKALKSYPLLDESDCEKYFTNITKSSDYVEIQSRGDVFWLKCTGNKKITCKQKNTQCFIPEDHITINNDKILCTLCKSEAKVYFAFPGTKEKDREMSTIIAKVWKYLAYRTSSVIVVGNSMEYDPVLLEFLKELLSRREIPMLYVSRFKGKNIKDEKVATRILCNNKDMYNSYWLTGDSIPYILNKILDVFNNCDSKNGVKNIPESFLEDKKNLIKISKSIISAKSKKDYVETEYFSKTEKSLINCKLLKNLSHCSQLGLKTFWLEGSSFAHNRKKHSIGVMTIASIIYLSVKKDKKYNENEHKFLRLGALLHDVGHLPFSHFIEEVFEEFGWKAFGEAKTFNHDHYTKKKITNYFEEDKNAKKILNEIGYCKQDLISLVKGEFGVGYLDAIINSPIDADKIEYLFSDSIATCSNSSELYNNFILDFTSDLGINNNNFLTIEGKSSKRLVELLEMRCKMYRQVYYRKGLRYLEACCKLIINTFIAYKCTEKDFYYMIEEGEINLDGSKYIISDYYNLSELKILYIIHWINNNTIKSKNTELILLEKIMSYFNDNWFKISETMKCALKKCYTNVKKTISEKKIEEIEKNFVKTHKVINTKFKMEQLQKIRKDIYLRFPGVLLIDYVKSKSFFSFSESGIKKKRSDGSYERIENILLTDIVESSSNQTKIFKSFGDSAKELQKELNIKDEEYIYFYKVTDKSYDYMQAEDYALFLLREEGIIGEDGGNIE